MSLPVNAGQLHSAANLKGISRRASRGHYSGQVLALALLSIERSGMIAEHGLDRGALALAWCQTCIIASIASRVLGGSSPLPPPRAAGLPLVDEDRSVYPQVYRLSPAFPGRRSWREPAR